MAVVFATTGLTSGEHLGLLQRRYRLRHPRPVGLGPAATVVVLIVGAGAVVMSAGVPAAAQDAPTITEVADGDVEGLSVVVRGSGLTYKGDAIELHFDNATGTTQPVHVPIGTRLVPDDPAIQTMFTAGDEVISVAPGGSSELIRAFCGEQDDDPPTTGTLFESHEPDPHSDEVATLERARDLFGDGSVTDDDIQHALWEITDGRDNSLDPRAQEISTRNSTPRPWQRGIAGLLGATPSAIAAGLLRWRSGRADFEPREPLPEGPWPDRSLVDEHGELISPDADGLYDQYVDGEWRKVSRDEAIELIRDARYWDVVNGLERQRALQEHEAWADRAWDDFVDDCRRRAATDRERAAVEAGERQWRLNAADRIENVAMYRGYGDILTWLGKDEHALPTTDQLVKLREFLGRRIAEDRAMARYVDDRTDAEFFVRGMLDDAGWVARQVSTPVLGPGGGAIAEAMVRNPEIPIRIAAAVKTGGWSETLLFAGPDIYRGLHAAADAKMAEQHLDLTPGEIAWEVIKVGLWDLGGRIGMDVLTSALQGRGVRGAYTGILGGVDEATETAARATARQGLDETGERFLRQVQDRLAGRTARHTNLELRMRLPDGSRTPPSGRDFIHHYLQQGDEILPHHWHETGLTVKQMRSLRGICRDEGVEALARTVDVDSMRHIRDGTGTAKPPFIQSAVITEADQYLNPAITSGDRGLAGFFQPVRPDLSKVPRHLHDDVMRQLARRNREYKQLRTQIDDLVAQGRVIERDGKLFEALTGKPYVADCDLVAFRDLSTGRVVGPGPRYEHLKARWINEVGGQHGAATNIVEDLTAGLRPGTPEYREALQAALEKQAMLQARHTAGERIVVQMGPDGVLRRGPVGADVDLYPEIDDLVRRGITTPPDVPIAPPTPTTPPTPEWPLLTNRPAPPTGAADDVAAAIRQAEQSPLAAGADELEVVGDQTFKGTEHAGQAGWSAEALQRRETFWNADGTPIPGVGAVDVEPPQRGFNIQYNARTGQATPRLDPKLTPAERQRLLRPGGPVDEAIERIRRSVGSPPQE
jgi:hypothetical protein